ncbi:MAG TPA: TerB family tellurite resistance protein [Dongiaceae bacterium]|nr:TerB family tellurite resistance protein [Dongiaceae bacterium]
MFDQILKLFTGPEVELSPGEGDKLRLCVAALLVEAAQRDDHFDEAERRAIERLLADRFRLSEAETRELLAAAERAVDRSTQLFRFIDGIVQRVEVADRVRIIEMLWEVAYADGRLDPDEDQLLRRIAGLIHVSDQDRGLARQRVMQRLGLR